MSKTWAASQWANLIQSIANIQEITFEGDLAVRKVPVLALSINIKSVVAC